MADGAGLGVGVGVEVGNGVGDGVGVGIGVGSGSASEQASELVAARSELAWEWPLVAARTRQRICLPACVRR